MRTDGEALKKRRATRERGRMGSRLTAAATAGGVERALNAHHLLLFCIIAFVLLFVVVAAAAVFCVPRRRRITRNNVLLLTFITRPAVQLDALPKAHCLR